MYCLGKLQAEIPWYGFFEVVINRRKIQYSGHNSSTNRRYHLERFPWGMRYSIFQTNISYYKELMHTTLVYSKVARRIEDGGGGVRNIGRV